MRPVVTITSQAGVLLPSFVRIRRCPIAEMLTSGGRRPKRAEMRD
jgi:hypothetical protein